jgi:hypothetical protein
MEQHDCLEHGDREGHLNRCRLCGSTWGMVLKAETVTQEQLFDMRSAWTALLERNSRKET